jgi:hypothetical protein
MRIARAAAPPESRRLVMTGSGPMQRIELVKEPENICRGTLGCAAARIANDDQ